VKIALVWKDDYPWDIRVEKIGKTLVACGHETHILARNLKKNKTEEVVERMIVHRLPPLRSDFFNTLSSIPAFFNPRWVWSLYRLCKRQTIDLIIVRDLPLMLGGLLVGRLLHIPVVFDMAELYSAMWADLNKAEGRFSDYLLKNPRVGKALERIAVKYADHTLVVVEEAKARLIEMGAAEHKISIVSNTPSIKEFERLQPADQAVARWNGKIVLLYHGHVNTARGLETVIQSMPALVDQFKNLLLVLIGDGDGLIPFKILTKQLQLEQHIEFTGWLPFDQIPPLIKAATMCVIPHLATEHKQTTIPNKLFDYMACGKPVIVSDAGPLRRIVEEENSGLVFVSGDVNSFIQAATRMISDPSLRQQLGGNGLEAVKREYNWEHDAAILNKRLEQLAARAHR